MFLVKGRNPKVSIRLSATLNTTATFKQSPIQISDPLVQLTKFTRMGLDQALSVGRFAPKYHPHFQTKLLNNLSQHNPSYTWFHSFNV